MRYSVDEVLSGMLASIEQETFTDDRKDWVTCSETSLARLLSLPRLPPWPMKPTFRQSWKARCKLWSTMDTWSVNWAGTS